MSSLPKPLGKSELMPTDTSAETYVFACYGLYLILLCPCICLIQWAHVGIPPDEMKFLSFF